MEPNAQYLEDKARDLQSRLAPQVEEARVKLMDLNQRVTTFIRERPTTCLVGALAFGYVVGKLASRR